MQDQEDSVNKKGKLLPLFNEEQIDISENSVINNMLDELDQIKNKINNHLEQKNECHDNN